VTSLGGLLRPTGVLCVIGVNVYVALKVRNTTRLVVGF